MQRNARAEKAAQKTGGREATGISEWCMKRVNQQRQRSEASTQRGGDADDGIDTKDVGSRRSTQFTLGSQKHLALTLLKQQDHSVGAFDHAGRG